MRAVVAEVVPRAAVRIGQREIAEMQEFAPDVGVAVVHARVHDRDRVVGVAFDGRRCVPHVGVSPRAHVDGARVEQSLALVFFLDVRDVRHRGDRPHLGERHVRVDPVDQVLVHAQDVRAETAQVREQGGVRFPVHAN
ncbi:MAG: hypothetical protein RBG13Loki_4148 [Promethearchaeota archaeon CR_4]|nr:MAG: hypothetical protein RBG13Loki_4148 [Candidatus Lokiarchaeota archaeon CR_4]